MKRKEITSKEKYEAQAKFCKENNLPLFAPISTCWSCGCDFWEGITIKGASNCLQTGCWKCNRSYCD